jgi:hypothetical protein
MKILSEEKKAPQKFGLFILIFLRSLLAGFFIILLIWTSGYSSSSLENPVQPRIVGSALGPKANPFLQPGPFIASWRILQERAPFFEDLPDTSSSQLLHLSFEDKRGENNRLLRAEAQKARGNMAKEKSQKEPAKEESGQETVLKPEFKNIKEKTGVYAFLAWLWLIIAVLIYVLGEQIKEADRRHRLGI